MRPTAIVAGAIANKPRNGGEAWVRLSWAGGLRRLGFDVHLVEQISPAACVDAAGRPAPFGDSLNRRYFRQTVEQFGWRERATLVLDDGRRGDPPADGLAWPALLDLARRTDLLVNISGHLTLAPLLAAVGRRAYVDIDPGFTQFWHADPATDFRVGGHDAYFTIGENIGSPGCPIPTGGIDWLPTRQPVVLDDWPVATPAAGGGVDGGSRLRFTTVSSWRGAFGPVTAGGVTFGLKAHEFRKYLSLPHRIGGAGGGGGGGGGGGPAFEVALDIHPADAADLAALRQNGWHVVAPRAASGDASAFRQYVQGSAAEFSVAQGIYVATNSGWFSDRTARYLASGKPALVQETGFSRNLSAGVGVGVGAAGLVPFRTPDEAVEGARQILGDYPAQCRAAREVAERDFDSDRVLTRFLADAGVGT